MDGGPVCVCLIDSALWTWALRSADVMPTTNVRRFCRDVDSTGWGTRHRAESFVIGLAVERRLTRSGCTRPAATRDGIPSMLKSRNYKEYTQVTRIRWTREMSIPLQCHRHDFCPSYLFPVTVTTSNSKWRFGKINTPVNTGLFWYFLRAFLWRYQSGVSFPPGIFAIFKSKIVNSGKFLG